MGHGRPGRGPRRGRARARAENRQRSYRRQQPQPENPPRRPPHDRAACAPGAKRPRRGGGERARIAGNMAAKMSTDLTPLCHPLAMMSVDVQLALVAKRNAVHIEATCKLKGRTGGEMEALTAASVAALPVYDMCKAVDRGMVISEVRLLHKSGGKSGTFDAR